MKEIEEIIRDSEIPIGSKPEVVELFTKCWWVYWVKNKDIKFVTPELKDMWFYLKIYLLSQIADQGSLKAIDKLKHELNVNAKKFENRTYTIKYAYKWMGV